LGEIAPELEIELAGECIPVALLREHAPLTCEAILSSLPLEGTANHARLAGDEIMFPVRTYIGPENQAKAQQTANVAYWPDRMMICVFYADTAGVGNTNIFGQVTGNLEGLRRAGEHVWKNQGARMRIRAFQSQSQG
jgi:hypothetical protein